jgi:hypothetical protein
MAILNYISIKQVISKIYRDLNIEQEERWVDIVEWCAEALQKIGAHPQYIERMEKIPVENYRATLPCDIHKIIQIEANGVALIAGTGSFDNQNANPEKKSMGNDYVYTINDAFINTNFEQGDIYMAYIAIPIDEEGFPLVPDDEGYKEAMEKYVVMKLKYPEFIAGAYNPNLYMKLEKDWHKWMRLLPEMSKHKRFFTKLNSGERIAGNRLPYTNRY